MKAKTRQDRGWLLKTATVLANRLKLEGKGTQLHIRIASRANTTNTDGWYVVIGNLGKNQPRLELWLDRFSGYPGRKFWAGFYSKRPQQITSITRRVSRKLWPVRTLGSKDLTHKGPEILNEPLKRSEFNAPILEKYSRGYTYYGIYDPTRKSSTQVNTHFCTRVLAFFQDVARVLPHASAEDEHREVFPQYENRKRVASHLQRERSRLLAAERKIPDNYKCRVCGLRFEDVYGEVGIGFAEAHHLVPLGQLKGQTRTRIEDLATVCANCHRMLHRMEGKRDDIQNLKAIVRRHRSGRK
jgi:5-methylcytosine-specific restriction endonuclease McrA